MRRIIIVLLIGIALQGLGGIALVAWWTRPARAASTATAAAPAPDERGAAAAPQPDLSRASRGPREAPFPRTGSPAEPAARAGRTERPPREAGPSARREALLSFRRDMKAGLASLQGRVAPCAATDASFTLDLETTEGGVRVIDARVETRGTAGDAAVACARSALVGETVPAPSAAPGRRWQMSFAPGSPR